jgi:hypothetical protein
MKSDPFADRKFRQEETNPTFLTMEELNRLYFTRRNFVRCSAVQKIENSGTKVCADYYEKYH